MADENNQIVVREAQAPVVAVGTSKSPTALALLASVGIPDNPGRTFSQVIKDYLKAAPFNLKGNDLTQAYYRILKQDLSGLIAARIQQAVADGWIQEFRPGKLSKEGKETRFSVSFFEPKAAKVKAISKTQEDRIATLFGGRDSALGKQVLEYLAKGGMLAKDPVVNAEATTVTEPAAS